MNRFAARFVDKVGLFIMGLMRDRRPLAASLPPAGAPRGLEGVAEAARDAAVQLGVALGAPVALGLGARAEDYVLRPAGGGEGKSPPHPHHAWPARTVKRAVSFPSPLPGPHGIDNTVRGLYYAPPADGPPPPSVVILHGYRQGALGPARLFARWCAEAGWGGMALALPYHISRRVPGTRNGELMVTADLGQLLRAARQAVADSLAAAEMLRRAGAPRVAVVGGSLGGWIAALAATCDPRLDAVLLLSPVAEPALLLERLSLLRRHRQAFRAAGIAPAAVERALEGVTPRDLAPAVGRERLYFAWGRHDVVTPPGTVERLWRAWGEPERKVHAHGHFSLLFLEPGLFSDAGRFLAGRGWPRPRE